MSHFLRAHYSGLPTPILDTTVDSLRPTQDPMSFLSKDSNVTYFPRLPVCTSLFSESLRGNCVPYFLVQEGVG